MDKAQAIYSFWSQFGLPCYDEITVPDNAPLPRLTYNNATGQVGLPIMLHAKIWYKDTSWETISKKSDAIAAALETGQVIKIDNGYIYFYKGSPFSQTMSDAEDATIRCIYINVTAEYLTS